MTNKQTIDGVSRERLAYWVECLESAGFKDIPSEMRTLLDMPELMCKGAMSLGTGCGECSRCMGELSIAAQPQGEIVSAKVSAYTPGMGLVEVRLSGGIPSWLELGESVTIIPELPQPQGEVERLRAELSKSNAAHEAAAQHQGELNTKIFQLERTLAEQNALLREVTDKCNIGFNMRERLLAALSTSAEPKPRGEPVAKAKPVAKLHAERLTGRDGEYGITVEDSQWFNTCRLTGGIFNLYAEQPAPLATEAAKAFAKGFNTLESGGGKYRINMQFQSREDAWGAFNVLARLKQLNTPQ